MIDGTHYRFDIAGLYNGLFVMSDNETGSIWTHYDGTVLIGPLAGTGAEMAIEPTLHLRWIDWLAEYPDTQVLARVDEYTDEYYRSEPGEAGLDPLFTDTLINELDERLPENELVLGVTAGDVSRAYRIDEQTEPTVISDELGDVPVVVITDPESLFGIAYEATVDGEVRSFSWSDGAIVDDTGTVWSLDGSSPDGQLRFVTSFISEWYGWAAYHPETTIFTP